MKERKRWVVLVDGERYGETHMNRSQAALVAVSLMRDGVKGVKVERR